MAVQEVELGSPGSAVSVGVPVGLREFLGLVSDPVFGLVREALLRLDALVDEAPVRGAYCSGESCVEWGLECLDAESGDFHEPGTDLCGRSALAVWGLGPNPLGAAAAFHDMVVFAEEAARMWQRALADFALGHAGLSRVIKWRGLAVNRLRLILDRIRASQERLAMVRRPLWWDLQEGDPR